MTQWAEKESNLHSSSRSDCFTDSLDSHVQSTQSINRWCRRDSNPQTLVPKTSRSAIGVPHQTIPSTPTGFEARAPTWPSVARALEARPRMKTIPCQDFPHPNHLVSKSVEIGTKKPGVTGGNTGLPRFVWLERPSVTSDRVAQSNGNGEAFSRRKTRRNPHVHSIVGYSAVLKS